MLALLRIVLGFALGSVFARAIHLAGPEPQTEGTTDAGYLAVAVGLGILNAIVWAPFFGRLLAEPLTGAFTSGHAGESRNALLQLAHKLALRRWRRMALFFAFLEGVRNPGLPGAFVIGLEQARQGSWLEAVFAKEVWRFDHAERCLRAWRVLKARGREPDLHRRPEVNLLIQSQCRVVPPPALALAVPQAAPPPAPRRNSRIQLFEGAPTGAVPAAGPGAVPDAGGSESVVPAESPGNSEAMPQSSASVLLEPEASPEPPASRSAGSAPFGWRDRIRVLLTGRARE